MKSVLIFGIWFALGIGLSGCGPSDENGVSMMSADQENTVQSPSEGSQEAKAQTQTNDFQEAPSSDGSKRLVYDDANDAIWTASGPNRSLFELAMAGGVGYFETRVANGERCIYAFEYETADLLNLELVRGESDAGCPRDQTQLLLERMEPNTLQLTSDNTGLLAEPLMMTTSRRNLLDDEFSTIPEQLDIVGVRIGEPIDSVSAKLLGDLGYTEISPNVIASEAFNLRAFVRSDGADEVSVRFNRIASDNPFVGWIKPNVFSITRKVTPDGGVAFNALRDGLVSKYGIDGTEIKPLQGRVSTKSFTFAPDGTFPLASRECERQSSSKVLNTLAGSQVADLCGTTLRIRMEALGQNKARVGTYWVTLYSSELAHPMAWYGNEFFALEVLEKGRQYLETAREATEAITDL